MQLDVSADAPKHLAMVVFGALVFSLTPLDFDLWAAIKFSTTLSWLGNLVFRLHISQIRQLPTKGDLRERIAKLQIGVTTLERFERPMTIFGATDAPLFLQKIQRKGLWFASGQIVTVNAAYLLTF